MEQEILNSDHISFELRALMVERILLEQYLDELNEEIDYQSGFEA